MTFPQKVDDKRWLATTRDRLRALQRQSGYHRYTQPSTAHDGQQFPFWSALHALMYRWYDGDMAADELKSATAQQLQDGDDAGMIPVVNVWSGTQPKSPFAAPPLLAFAAVAVYHLTGDYNLIERLYPQLTAAHDWFTRQREQDGLVIPAHPAETLRGSLEDIDAPEAYAPTWRDIIELNCLRAADLDAVAHLASDMGNKADAAVWDARAQAVRQALAQAAQTHDPQNLLLLFAEAVPSRPAIPLAARVQAADGLCLPDDAGASVSLVDQWLVYVGLRAYDLRPVANRVAEVSLGWVEAAGDYARFDTATGAGIGASGQSAAALAVEMLFRERQSTPPGAQCI